MASIRAVHPRLAHAHRKTLQARNPLPIVPAMKNAQTGFTLLELMLVLTIAGIILGFGVPAMGDFIRNARITGAANDVMASLHYARSEAIKRRQAVTVCTSADPLIADPGCDATTVLTGWIVFVDANQNGTRDAASFVDIDGDGTQDLTDEDINGDGFLNAGEDIDLDGNLDVVEASIPAEVLLQQREPLDATITARGTRNPLRVTYLDNGFSLNANSSQMVLCDARGNVASSGQLSAARGITLATTGRAGVTRDKNEIQALVTAIGGSIGGCS